MPKGVVLRFAYFMTTIPVDLIGRLLLLFNIFNLKEKLEKCIQVVDQQHTEI